jgi:uncharacterized ParB-like nuclease family protein
MSCCGETKRAVIRQEDIDRGLAFEVEYAGARTITVIGAVTGQPYTFSGLHRLQLVDPRDAGTLLRERVFRLKRVIQPVAS